MVGCVFKLTVLDSFDSDSDADQVRPWRENRMRGDRC